MVSTVLCNTGSIVCEFSLFVENQNVGLHICLYENCDYSFLEIIFITIIDTFFLSNYVPLYWIISKDLGKEPENSLEANFV